MNDSGPPLSVLAVDDDADTARSTAQLLALFGHVARAALGGEEALRSAAADPPDVVLLDIRMPGLDGCELARRLAARTTAKPPLVVAVSGCGTDADRERARAAGVHVYLVKPVDPAVLVGMMGRFRQALAPDPRAPLGSDDANSHALGRSLRLADFR